MASFVAKKVAKHVMKESATNKFGTEDPYFEQVAAVDMNGNATGKFKKRRRAVPPGLTTQEEKVLKKVTRRAYRLDNAFNFCGIRIGWGAVVGLIPALGDVFDTLMALMVFRTCNQVKLPTALRSRMMLNIIMDFVVGIIPVLGDVADALFRANTRNAALLYEHLRERGAARIAAGEKSSGFGRPENGEALVTAPRPVQGVTNHPNLQGAGHPATADPVRSGGHNAVPGSGSVAQPQPAKLSNQGGSHSWFSRSKNEPGSGGHRDLESGEMGKLPPRR